MATTYVLCSRVISSFEFQVTHSNLSKSLYKLGRSRLNFGDYMNFESTIKALKPDILPFTSQIASFDRGITQFQGFIFLRFAFKMRKKS